MNNFLNLFNEHERSATIEKLAKKFIEEKIWIADAMELSGDKKDNLKYFIHDEEKCKQHEAQFLIFGQATHSGSAYAFYKKTGSSNCDEWPILVLNDGGGAVFLAKNIFDAMRFWTLNSVQPYVDFDDRNFDLFTDEDIGEDPESSNQAYKDWIQSEFGLAPLNSIEQAQKEVIQPAIDLYQPILNEIFKELS